MRVLLPLHGFVAWNGGLDLVRLITMALSTVASERNADLHFALPVFSRKQRVLSAMLRYWRTARASRFRSGTQGSAVVLTRFAREVAAGFPLHECADSPRGILQICDEIRPEFVFPTMFPLGNSKQRRIGYIFDFQHRYLPELFSTRTRRNRDDRFARLAADANGIVVNSRGTAEDVCRFLGVPRARVLAMPFAPYAKREWFELPAQTIAQQYGLNGRYLLVCNHFWKHKDHATALRAFAQILKNPAQADLQLALTGDPVDHRDPQHYQRLLGLASDLGVSSRVRFLGLIPKRDQIALLRGTEALLQPTLFEGGPGGGSVYEAIGLGVPCIVSDVAVNREIEGGCVHFFRAGDPADMAEKTVALLASQPRRPNPEELLAQGQANLRQLGNAILYFLETCQ